MRKCFNRRLVFEVVASMNCRCMLFTLLYTFSSPITENSEPSGSSLGSTNSTGHSTVNPLMMNSTNHHTRSHFHDSTTNSTRHDQSHAAQVLQTGASERKSENRGASKPPANADTSMDKTCHEIDLSNYVYPDIEEQADPIFNMSIAIDPSDPFDEELISRFLKKLPVPLEAALNHYTLDYPMPALNSKANVTVG